MKFGLLFIFGPFYEYSNLEYVRVFVEHRVHQAEYVVHMRVAASQEYVNTYSTRRRHKAPTTDGERPAGDPHSKCG